MHLTALIKYVACTAIATCFAYPAFAQTLTASPITVEPFRSTNVRSGPSVTFEVIDVLELGQVVEATGRSDSYSNWLQVNLGSRRGWVAFFTVAVSGDITTLPIVEVTDAPPTPSPAPAPVSQEATSDIFVTAYRRVNVRNGPGTDFDVLGALVPGQTADIIGTSGDSNEWLQINFNGEPGWIAYFVVTISGELSDLDATVALSPLQTPATTVQEDTTGSVLNQVIVITRFNTNLREEPVLGSEVLTIIPFETTLQALARTADSRWLRVRHNDDMGWLISSLVNTGVSDIDTLPIIGANPSTSTTAEE